jgi:Tfp pilus assembly protein PilO
VIDTPLQSGTAGSGGAADRRVERVREILAAWAGRVRAGFEQLRDGRHQARFRQFPQIGKLTGIGLVLLTTSAVLWFSTLVPMKQQVAELREDVRRQEARALKGGGAPSSLSAQARAFIRRLPARDELPVVLAMVVSQAKAAGLQLERGAYEFTMAKSGTIARYRVTLPVSGTYVQIQKFVDGTLAVLPPVALESLKIERDAVGDRQLQANLQFAVMVRSE